MKRLAYVLIGFSIFVGGGALTAETLDEVSSRMNELSDQALDSYNETIAEIGEERLPLVKRIGELEIQNAELRGSVNRLRRIVNSGKAEIEKLDVELDELGAQTDYIARSLDEYLVKFESRIHLAEDQNYKAQLLQIREGIDSDASNSGSVFALQADAVELGLSRAEKSMGGLFFEGRAIASNGDLLEGKVAVVGPAAYFTTNDGVSSGLLRFHSGTIEPALAALPEPNAGLVANVVNSRSGGLPLDSSLGNALSLKDANLSFVAHIQQGGFVGYFILFLGAMALILSIVKLSDMSKSSLASQESVQEVALIAREEGAEAAAKKANDLKGPLGEMVQMGVRNLGSSKLFLEEMMLSVILKKRPEMERFLPFLAITAAAAPLLGLLGTVVGMIKTFALITIFGTGDPKALSSGISEALVTTELGLSVAIPTLVLHGLFMRMVKSRIGVMEQSAFDFVKIATSKEED